MSRRAAKDILVESFKELLQETAFDKITIKMITDRAGVIRPTFYHHFADKYEVVEWICKEEVFDAGALLIDNGMPIEAIRLMFSKIEKNKAFFMKIVKIEGQNDFKEIFYTNLLRLFVDNFRAYGDEDRDYKGILRPTTVAMYYAQGLTFIIKAWLTTGMPISAAEAAENYLTLVTHSIEDIFTGRGK